MILRAHCDYFIHLYFDVMVWFVLFLSAGVTGILPTEIFNQNDRPAAYMIAGSMMWLNLFFIGMIFPFLVVSLFIHTPSMYHHLRILWDYEKLEYYYGLSRCSYLHHVPASILLLFSLMLLQLCVCSQRHLQI